MSSSQSKDRWPTQFWSKKKLTMNKFWTWNHWCFVCVPQDCMSDSKWFDLPEIPKNLVQGFSRVNGCNIRQSKVLQIWEMNKSCSLQNTQQMRGNLMRNEWRLLSKSQLDTEICHNEEVLPAHQGCAWLLDRAQSIPAGRWSSHSVWWSSLSVSGHFLSGHWSQILCKTSACLATRNQEIL